MNSQTRGLRTNGNPTGALSKAKLENMKAMADFGLSVKEKVHAKIIKGLNSKDLNKALKSCEIVLRYTCPIPKDVPEEANGNPLEIKLFEILESLQKENERLKCIIDKDVKKDDT